MTAFIHGYRIIEKILDGGNMINRTVKWKVNLYGDADAQKVYEEIGEETTTPEQVLEKAKNPKSELHKCFEWDDKKAAYKYRLQQARTVMCNLVFVSNDETDEIRTHYALTFEKSEYHPTVLIIKNVDEYKALLSKAKGELFAFKKKYAMIKELKNIFDAIEEL